MLNGETRRRRTRRSRRWLNRRVSVAGARVSARPRVLTTDTVGEAEFPADVREGLTGLPLSERSLGRLAAAQQREALRCALSGLL